MVLLTCLLLILLFCGAMWIIGHTPMNTPVWIDGTIFFFGFICLMIGVSRLVILAVAS